MAIAVRMRISKPVVGKIDLINGMRPFLETYGKCDPHVGLLCATLYSQAEKCNGGFTQFFANSTGILAPEAVVGCVALGMPDAAHQIELAMEILGYPTSANGPNAKTRLRSSSTRSTKDLDVLR